MIKKISSVLFAAICTAVYIFLSNGYAQASPGLLWEIWGYPSDQWEARYSMAAVFFNGKTWVLGGQTASSQKNDVWNHQKTDECSVCWTQVTANAAWPARAGHAAVVFNNKMWVIGGASGGIDKNDVWSSMGGVDWGQATANAGWPTRSGLAAVVFDNKIWVLGGASGGIYKNDVWYSSDGRTWTQATANADWSARSNHAVVVYDNNMYVIGGIANGVYKNDVWYSSDGINWTQATANASWAARSGHSVVVMDGKMLLIGGGNASNYYNDIWLSKNGSNWASMGNFIVDGRISHRAVVDDTNDSDNPTHILVLGGWSSKGILKDVLQGTPPRPTIDLKINNSDGPVLVPNNATFTLSWTTTNAEACYGTEGWTGSKALSSSGETYGPRTDSAMYYLWCTNFGRSNNDRAFLEVTIPTCTENWSCGAWSSCLNSEQSRTCTDANNCGTVVQRPALTQTCVMSTCTENWSCGSWSSCLNSQQSRTCTDLNSCGTLTGRPAIQQSCQCQESWSCSEWSVCQNNQKTRTCTDAHSCGTTDFKPATAQSCDIVCSENWSCGEWSTCVTGKQTRSCSDSNICGTSVNKPAIEKTCVCTENWTCGDWTPCVNGQQTKTCIDLNNCGTSKNKPSIKQSCSSTREEAQQNNQAGSSQSSGSSTDQAGQGPSNNVPAEQTNNQSTSSGTLPYIVAGLSLAGFLTIAVVIYKFKFLKRK